MPYRKLDQMVDYCELATCRRSIIYLHILEKIIHKKNAADAIVVFLLKKTLMQR